MKVTLKSSAGARARCWTVDAATGKRSRKTAWTKNLMLDNGLNRIASTVAFGYAGWFKGCSVGSSNAPNSYAGGSVTFSQTGTTLTSSTGFFTSAMVGAIFKQGSGTGGSEVYITAFTSSTQVTVSAPQTLIAVVGTVWMVQQTTLTSYLYGTTSYVGTTGANGTTFSGSTCTMLRTFQFPVQSSNYTVNEVGYFDQGQTGSAVNGRIVLGASVVVPPTQFLVVQIELVVTQAPSSPVSVSDVSGGVFNTSGQAMLQTWACTSVASNGSPQAGYLSLVDGQQSINMDMQFNQSGALSLNTSISTTATTAGALGPQAIFAAPSNVSFAGSGTGNNYSICQGNGTFNFTQASTATCYGLVFSGPAGGGTYSQLFAINFTTPITMTAGTYTGTCQYQVQFYRTLSN